MKININRIRAISSGLEMTVPVNLVADILHTASHGSHVSQESILINSLLAFSIYKYDRYRDALTAKDEDISDLYRGILDNRKPIEFLLFSSTICTLVLLFNFHMNALFPVYTSTFLYKNIKTLDFPMKPFYVSSLWATSVCVIPEYNNPDILACISAGMCIFALTNIADTHDYNEDIKLNVSSLPTEIGIEAAKYISATSSLISVIAFLNLEYSSFDIYTAIFILSNVIPFIQG